MLNLRFVRSHEGSPDADHISHPTFADEISEKSETKAKKRNEKENHEREKRIWRESEALLRQLSAQVYQQGRRKGLCTDDDHS